MTQNSSVARFFGYAMIAIGVLMALLSGGCTLVGLYIALNDRTPDMFGLVLLVGLPFLAIGVGLFFGGRRMIRDPRPKQPPGDVF